MKIEIAFDEVKWFTSIVSSCMFYECEGRQEDILRQAKEEKGLK